VARIDLEDELAHRDRLHQEAVLGVAIGGALEGGHRVARLAEAAVRLGGALGPLGVGGLEALQLQVAFEGALVLAGGRCLRSVLSQLSRVLRHWSRAL
jgi:hypothetical protein